MSQLLLPFEQDAIDAAQYWRNREFKVFAVDVSAGPERKPTYRHTFYAQTRDADRAIKSVQRNAFGLPGRARYRVRLAGPRELGCIPTGGSA